MTPEGEEFMAQVGQTDPSEGQKNALLNDRHWNTVFCLQHLVYSTQQAKILTVKVCTELLAVTRKNEMCI